MPILHPPPQTAIGDYTKVIQIVPDAADAYDNLGIANFQLGQ